MKEADLELLREIARFEDSHDMDELRMGWSWRHVRVWPATLSGLFKDGYLKNVFRSNSYTGYRLSELGWAALVTGSPHNQPTPPPDQREIHDNLFADIIGHGEVKELLRACLQTERPVHVLLAGPPALAKSLFLWDIEKAAGEKALWLVGSATSKGGLWDKIAEAQARIILIDELDKMNAIDTAALLSVMEGGRLVRTKVGRELDLSIPVRVVAACNRLKGLSPELLSRFATRTIQGYSREDFMAVVKGVLVRHEGLGPDEADEVARRLDGITQDVRDAVRVARLAPQVGVKRAIELLLGEAALKGQRG